MSTTRAVRTLGLSKRFGAVDARDGLDLEVPQAEVPGCLGSNGAGKTTTLRLLMGLLRPTSGRTEIFGLDVQREKVAAHRWAAYVPGEPNLWPALTGEETLHLLGRVHGWVHLDYRDQLVERFVFDPSMKVSTVTGLDILANRFEGAGHDSVRGGGNRPLAGVTGAVDPVLGCPTDQADMNLGGVGEGSTRLNPALSEPAVLEAALTRFGCCGADEAPGLTQRLLSHVRAETEAGPVIRVVAFGDAPPDARTRSLAHGADGSSGAVPAALPARALVGPAACTGRRPGVRRAGAAGEAGTGAHRRRQRQTGVG